jgi:homoserine kinase
MREGEMLKIVVPASTANLGPGFDSIGLAVSRYLTLEVTLSDDWCFVPRSGEVADIPTGTENLIFQVADKLAKEYEREMPCCLVNVYSDIPLARGLGSSAAAIIAGIELANELMNLSLPIEEKARFASCFEGHPDNVGASLYGGLVIGSHRKEETNIVHINDFELDLVVIIPDYELKTTAARDVLPNYFALMDAVEASSVSNVLVAALLTKNWHLAGKMMDCDLFHQPYRKAIIPELQTVQAVAKEYGAFGVALSGAGPTVICFAESGKGSELHKKLSYHFRDYLVEFLSVERNGSQVYKMALEK